MAKNLVFEYYILISINKKVDPIPITRFTNKKAVFFATRIIFPKKFLINISWDNYSKCGCTTQALNFLIALPFKLRPQITEKLIIKSRCFFIRALG